jgi:hypothetical protein
MNRHFFSRSQSKCFQQYNYLKINEQSLGKGKIITYGLNVWIESLVDGFIMNLPPASQVDELNGQHMEAVAELPTQVDDVQSCTAPNVCPIS